jgi:predicted RNA binding protein YcfA (HicA-like mRNA interferase family)
MPAAAAAASWLLPPRRFAMNRLRWWLVSGAGIPWALRIGARVSSTHPTGQRACRRPAHFIVGGQPRLPGISQMQAVRVFQKLGYRVVRESGHLIMSNGTTRLVIPRHDPINAITMGAIARDAGLTPEQFRQLL